MNRDLLRRDLPKWPQLRLKGKDIKEEQALEIIRRTDSFFVSGYGGNNRPFEDRVRKLFGMPPDRFSSDKPVTSSDPWYDPHEKWSEKWGVVNTEYLHNTWVASAYIGGPYGWCHPNGVLYYRDNIGKWPSVGAVYGDFVQIAREFTFLHIDAVLMSGDGYSEKESSPVVGFLVRGRDVEIVEPDDSRLWAEVGPFSDYYPNRFRIQALRYHEEGGDENYFKLSDIRQIWADHLVE